MWGPKRCEARQLAAASRGVENPSTAPAVLPVSPQRDGNATCPTNQEDTALAATQSVPMRNEAGQLAAASRGVTDPSTAPAGLPVSPRSGEPVTYCQRQEEVRAATNATRQPRKIGNGCCLMASVLSIVDQPRHKQLLLGWESEDGVNVERAEAYQHWDLFFRQQRYPGEKYEQGGLRLWLNELVKRGILEDFQITHVKELSSEAGAWIAGHCEGSGGYDHEGVLVFGHRLFGESRDKEIRHEILKRIGDVPWGTDFKKETISYANTWRILEKAKVPPLSRYFLWNCTQAVGKEAKERFGRSAHTPGDRAELEAHAVCVRAECRLAWEDRMQRMLQRDTTVIEESTGEELGESEKGDTESENEDQNAAAHMEFVRTTRNRVLRKLRGHPNEEGAREGVMMQFEKGLLSAHLRYPIPEGVGVTWHGICVRASDETKEVVICDPSRTETHLMSRQSVQKSTEALMNSLVDYWKAIGLEFTFAAKWRGKFMDEQYAQTHEEWKKWLRQRKPDAAEGPECKKSRTGT
eukprot:gene11270-8010_t